ncbi:MAG: archease [Bacteroidota bacterium]
MFHVQLYAMKIFRASLILRRRKAAYRIALILSIHAVYRDEASHSCSFHPKSLSSCMNSSFTIIDHPSDMGIEARGASLKEAFEQAAYGLLSIILDYSKVEINRTEFIRVNAADREQLLVRWLNEILFCFDGQHFVPKVFSITELSDKSLTAEVRGEYYRPAGHRTKLDVKAVTYHQLAVTTDKDGALVRVFVDI